MLTGILPLWAAKGEQLHELLKQHGTFEAVECHLQKWQESEQKDSLQGGWENEITLAALGWTEYHVRNHETNSMHSIFYCISYIWSVLFLRDMIKASKAWAAARGLVETNEVHGKEEWRVPTKRTFEHIKRSGTRSSQQVSFMAEDPFMKLSNFSIWIINMLWYIYINDRILRARCWNLILIAKPLCYLMH